MTGHTVRRLIRYIKSFQLAESATLMVVDMDGHSWKVKVVQDAVVTPRAIVSVWATPFSNVTPTESGRPVGTIFSA